MQIEFQLPLESASQAVTAWGLKDRLIAVILDQLDQLRDSLPEKEEVMAAAKAAFRKYVVPIDIPNIGPVFENIVDQQMEALFLRFVSAAYDRIARA